MKIFKLSAHSSCFHGKRDRDSVMAIVMHGTGNAGDTAHGNAEFFSREQSGSRRGVGAHFFVGSSGDVYKSIPMNVVAYSVGGDQRSGAKGEAKYYGKLTNQNTVSIELCDSTKGVTWKQMLAVCNLVKYIQKYCPNAKKIVRHWDINGKICPEGMTGQNNKRWERLYNKITKGYQFKARVKKKACIRSTGKVGKNVLGSRGEGEIVLISKVVGKWGRLLHKDKKGKWQWISLKKVTEI